MSGVRFRPLGLLVLALLAVPILLSDKPWLAPLVLVFIPAGWARVYLDRKLAEAVERDRRERSARP